MDNQPASDQQPIAPKHLEELGLLAAFASLAPKVKVLAVLLAVQCLAVTVYTLIGLFNLVTGKIEHLSVGIALLVSTALLAWFLFALVRGVIYGRTWVRGPAMTLQIFMVLVGVSLVQGTLWAAGLGVIAFGIATVSLLLSKQALAHIGVRELAQD